MAVFVLLFNAGTDDEELYISQQRTRNVVLMFEDEDEAIRYAVLLRTRNFPLASVKPVDESEIKEFCESIGYETQFLARGQLQVFVLLFNVDTDNEGIHSLRVGDRDIVLLFEDEDDATRFALMLEAQDFPEATVEGMDEREIQEFCDSVGYSTKFVPCGSFEIPPEQNLDETAWREDGMYDEDEGDRLDRDDVIADNPDDDEPKAFSAAELERLRHQLEKLL